MPTTLQPADLNQDSAGFTLIEVMVVIFLGALLLFVILGLYSWHSSIYKNQEATVRMSEAGRRTLGALQSYVSQANHVLSGTTINGTVYSSGSQALVLQLPAIDNANNVIGGKWDTVVVYASSTQLFLLVSPDPASNRPAVFKQLGDTLQSLNFTYDNGNFSLVKQVSVSLTTQVQVGGRTVSQSLQQDMYLYNYY